MNDELPDDLRAWASAIGTATGALPLVGTGLRAGPYPALLWNGARLHRAGATLREGLVMVAMAAAAEGAIPGELDRAVDVGVRMAQSLDDVGAGPHAGLTLGVVPAAACAAMASGGDPGSLGAVIEMAGSLMVVTAPEVGDEVQHGMWAGHCLAAGWLAVQVVSAGLVTMPGALEHTVGVVTGQDATGPRERLA